MKYQVWVKAHDRKTLAVIAEVLVFEHEDRLETEKLAETPRADDIYLFGPYVRTQNPLYRTETRIPGWGVPAAQYKPGDPNAPGGAKIAGHVAPVQQRCQCPNPDIDIKHLGRCSNCGRPV